MNFDYNKVSSVFKLLLAYLTYFGGFIALVKGDIGYIKFAGVAITILGICLIIMTIMDDDF